MKSIPRLATALAIAPLALGLAAGAQASGVSRDDCASGSKRHDGSLQVVGLTSDQRLICFSERRPYKARDIGFVQGLVTDERLVGIDFRVQDGSLYGVGNAGGVYTLDTQNATATLVNRLSVTLSGTSFGVDFNPAADRLRIVSDTGQNLRHSVLMGGTTLQDDALDYPVAAMLNSVGPTALGITGSAYTNNDVVADTATTLYALDTNLDQIAIQSPPNDGTLAATGKLGVDAQAVSGFDIYSTLREGVSVGAQAFAALSLGDGRTALYKVTLSTGKATQRRAFAIDDQVIDIAIPLDQR